MPFFENKTALITGASRGIGKAIALKLAGEGANIIIASKSVEEHPKLGGTIFSAAKAVEAAGGQALPVQCDIRFEAQIKQAVEQGVEAFGGIDILINNASAINLNPIEKMEPKRYDLMQDINVRGAYFTAQACLPYLKKGRNPHILTLSPPLNFKGNWLANHLAYTLSKYGMTMVALGLSGELKQYGIAANSLWPQTTIATAAIRNLLGGEEMMKRSRKPAILADTVYYILKRAATKCTGNTFIDEEVLAAEGITDLQKYAVDETTDLQQDLFL